MSKHLCDFLASTDPRTVRKENFSLFRRWNWIYFIFWYEALQLYINLPTCGSTVLSATSTLKTEMPPSNGGQQSKLILTYLLTYLLTPWCRILLEKLTGLQLVKKFPAFHGTRRFITALTSVRHLSLSWASPIQSIYPHPTSWRSILILSIYT